MTPTLAFVVAAAALTLVAQVLARGVSRFVLGYPSQRGGVHPPRRLRIVVVALLALGLDHALDAGAVGPPWTTALAHWALLAAVGVALARWCVSSERSPVIVTLVLLLWASTIVARELGLEAATVRLLTMLPADTSVAWAAWHLAAARGRISAGDQAAYS